MKQQKQYCILERESNGKFARMSAYKTREEATNVLSKIFRNDKNADPQDFKIVEEEIEGQTEFDKLMDKLMNRLSHLTTKFIMEPYGTMHDNRQCATLVIDNSPEIWTSTAIRIIMEALDNKATFTISRNPLNDRVDMLIVES